MIDAVPIEIGAKQLSCCLMTFDPSQLPDDIATLKAMVIAGGQEIEALKLTIAKMRRDKFGASSERGAELLDQLELQQAELEEGFRSGYASAEINAPPTTDKERQFKPARRPLPQHLPRERVMHSARRVAPVAGVLSGSSVRTLPRRWRPYRHSGSAREVLLPRGHQLHRKNLLGKGMSLYGTRNLENAGAAGRYSRSRAGKVNDRLCTPTRPCKVSRGNTMTRECSSCSYGRGFDAPFVSDVPLQRYWLRMVICGFSTTVAVPRPRGSTENM